MAVHLTVAGPSSFACVDGTLIHASTLPLKSVGCTPDPEESAMAPVSANETELEMVRRHIQAGADHVAEQRSLIARLGVAGLPTDRAERLLANFEDLQAQHEDHLVRILAREASRLGAA